MAAGDVTMALRAYSDEQIEQDKRTCIELLRRHDEDPQFKLSKSVEAWDIANRYQTWEFRSGELFEAPRLFHSRISWTLDAIENGVDDWFLTATPDWAYCTWTDYEADVPGQRIYHEGPTVDVAGGRLFLKRVDVVDMEAETVAEGPLLVELDFDQDDALLSDYVAGLAKLYARSIEAAAQKRADLDRLFIKEVAS
ncbi:hypothetical protein [Curtobacterium flaccumfaciens]|uniref:hypothetical protein n=1 Tax=Curtobacterium flaccumfaciens TaxID=2035 RepID=UPI001ADBF1A3|nr:hypothetical protein [Curtobacterium flaccumfaciens]MBO9043491.1 hypothetical protein [Curtobacterium flaccumfaciens pv. flaccumfaciens]